jgi:Ca2+-binding EF-hand superfamily protein
MASPEDQAIQGVIDQIWSTYDVDNSGELDKEETKKFVQDTLGNLGSGDEFSDEAFSEVFATFDKDGSGNIDKAEMVTFIKQLLGGA